MGEMVSTAQIIAILLGFICGTIMTAALVFIPMFLKKRALKKKSNYVENEFMSQELAHAYAALIFAFVFCAAAIIIYNQLAPETLAWFGVTAVFWYFIGYTAYTLQKVLKERKNSEKS